MAVLIPEVRALNLALALTGTQMESFVETQEAMQDASGASEEAFEKQADTFLAETERMNLLGDVPALFLVAIILWYLMPKRA